MKPLSCAMLALALLAMGCSEQPAEPAVVAPPEDSRARSAGPLPRPKDPDSGQYIPIARYGVGPAAAVGLAAFAGYLDYIELLNVRDGGINGIWLTHSECDTKSWPRTAAACYEELKHNGPTGASLFSFMAPEPTAALLEQGAADGIAIVAAGYGPAALADGRVFPYGFNLLLNPWRESAVIIHYIARQEQCLSRRPELQGQPGRAAACYERGSEFGKIDPHLLAGRTVANLYLDSEYGRETLPMLQELAERYGFRLLNAAVVPPGIDQVAAWRRIAGARSDWVILRGWGVMNPLALKQAAASGFPAERIVGGWWSGAEQDVIPAGRAARGYSAVAVNPSGDDFPVIRQIKERLYQPGGGHLPDGEHIGTSLYNRGVIHAVLQTEAIRAAQLEFGNKPLNARQIRWGLENLELGEARLKALGLEGMIPPVKLTCSDHEGGVPVRFQQWDGERWRWVSGSLEADQALIRPLVEKAAADYAKAHGITPRDCSLAGYF